MEEEDFELLKKAPMTLWPLILDIIKERREYDYLIKIEAQKMEFLKKKYAEVIQKQEQALENRQQEQQQ